ncbi:conjugal transfer protein TraH [Sulfurimonas indica]|uniref:conjugal transfer protein TraH n=1 Tax=Sulfurimonas TaxID=202746 RepID=UPI0012652ED2|nr:conjugal transfer protein TraH [Sulfurimonas indica]
MKKMLSVFMAFVVFSQQTYAANLSDLVDTAHTKSSEWQSPATGSKYFYSGSYEFSFKKSNGYAPWINAGSTTGNLWQAGCNGFSTGDMFVSMLGLNDIKDQLSDAGAQLAWGVMLALVMSMPGLQKTFAAIQKWARAIQNLLQNACSIGQSIGNSDLFGPIRNTITGKNSDVGIAIQNADKGISGFVDDSANWINSFTSSSDSNTTAAAKDAEKGSSLKEILKTLKGVFGISSKVAASKITDAALPKDSSTNTLYIGDLSTFLSNGTIGGKNFVNSSDLDALKTKILLDLVFVGDTALSAKGLKSITDLTDCTSVPGGEYCKVNPTKIADSAIEHMADGDKGIKNPSYVNLSPIVSSTDKVADAIINGFSPDSSLMKTVSGDSMSGDGYCYIYNHKITVGDFTYKAKAVSSTSTSGSPSKKVIRFISLVSSNHANTAIKLEWEGALKESYKLIKYKIKEKSGINGNIGLFENEPITADSNSIIPVLVPGASKYFRIIATLERKDGQETGYTASLKQLLAQYNAYLFSSSFFDSLIAQIDSSIHDTPAGGDKIENLKAERERLVKIRENVQERFHKVIQDTRDFKLIVDIFSTIEKNQHLQRSNMLR